LNFTFRIEIQDIHAGLKIFLSYHSSDRHLAGEIKLHLANYGLDVFLAHEDIEPAEEWQTRILSELKSTSVFLPLLTESFMVSRWTAQECGVAVARGTFIVSLKVAVDPFGFLAKNQALNFRTDHVARSCLGIARAIHRNLRLQKRFLDGLIESVRRSTSFEEAIRRTSLLNEFTGYNRRQATEAVKSAIDNPQIHRSYGARRRMDTFIKKNMDRIDKGMLNSYADKISRIVAVKVSKPRQD